PPHDPVAVGLLPGIAERQGAVVANLAVDHAVEEVAAVFVRAQPGFAVLVRGDHATGPAAVVGERGGVVELGALRAPRAVAQAERALPLVGRALAHVVDGAGRVAHAGEQAVGAADHFHLLVAEGIGRTRGHAPAVGHADAVDLGVED